MWSDNTKNKLTFLTIEGATWAQIYIKGGTFMQNPIKRTISIGEAARLTGVTVKQIRHWQSRGYIPEKPRVICGERAYRHFDDDDLLIIRRIKNYLDVGFRLNVAAEKAKSDISTEKGGRKNA